MIEQLHALLMNVNIIAWSLANFECTGVVCGRPSAVVTRVLMEKRQSPVIASIVAQLTAESKDAAAGLPLM